MIAFVNDFQGALVDGLHSAGTYLPLPAPLAQRLDFAAGKEYLLTLTDSLDLGARSATEIVRVSAGLSIERGQEGTSSQSWPSGTLVMCSITAGGLAEIAASRDGGGGSDEGGGGLVFRDEPPMTPPDAAGLLWLYSNGPDCALYCSTGTASPYDWEQIWPAEYGSVLRIAPTGPMTVATGPDNTLIVDMAVAQDGQAVNIISPPVISQRGWRLVIDYRGQVGSWFQINLPGDPPASALDVRVAQNRHYGIRVDEAYSGGPLELELWDGFGRPTVIEVFPAYTPGKVYEVHISSLRGAQEEWQPITQG